jgi:hypothetical protein
LGTCRSMPHNLARYIVRVTPESEQPHPCALETRDALQPVDPLPERVDLRL